jgi:hypothetical protein
MTKLVHGKEHTSNEWIKLLECGADSLPDSQESYAGRR